MNNEELIKDLNLQVGVANQLFSEEFSKHEAAKDYLRGCHAIMDQADVPQSLPLHERILWLVRCMKPIPQINFPKGGFKGNDPSRETE